MFKETKHICKKQQYTFVLCGLYSAAVTKLAKVTALQTTVLKYCSAEGQNAN